jgi:hypothetical protein
MKNKVELDELFPHPPERVWQALTDAGALSHWLMPTDFQPLIGYRFRLQRPSGSAVSGRVIDAVTERLLAYTWEDDEEGQTSKIVWTLDPVEGGTRLRLEQVLIEEPAVTCLAIDSYFNWSYALRYSLPGLLQLLKGGVKLRPPIVYIDSESDGSESLDSERLIGFRQEKVTR